MSYSPEHKERTRERILDSAAALVREKGLEKTGVAEVMGRAGLTVGGFYSHFKSREQLLAHALLHAFELQDERFYGRLASLEGEAWTKAMVGAYLSTFHRDHPEQGCPFAALISEFPRAGRPVRAMISRAYEGWVAMLTARLGSRDEALALSALLVGALTLSRVADGAGESKEVLQAATRLASRLLSPEEGR